MNMACKGYHSQVKMLQSKFYDSWISEPSEAVDSGFSTRATTWDKSLRYLLSQKM